jgi:transcriptional regulator with XRE-family HTH domain
MRFADWLRETMAKNGWSSADLARKAHISNSMVSNYLGGVPPRVETLAKIARATGVPEAFLRELAGRDPTGAATEVDPIIPEIREILSRMPRPAQERAALPLLRVAVEMLDETARSAAHEQAEGRRDQPAEELALECQASARENAALALELNRLANRFLDLSRAYAGTGNHAPERLAS